MLFLPLGHHFSNFKPGTLINHNHKLPFFLGIGVNPMTDVSTHRGKSLGQRSQRGNITWLGPFTFLTNWAFEILSRFNDGFSHSPPTQGLNQMFHLTMPSCRVEKIQPSLHLFGGHFGGQNPFPLISNHHPRNKVFIPGTMPAS